MTVTKMILVFSPVFAEFLASRDDTLFGCVCGGGRGVDRPTIQNETCHRFRFLIQLVDVCFDNPGLIMTISFNTNIDLNAQVPPSNANILLLLLGDADENIVWPLLSATNDPCN